MLWNIDTTHANVDFSVKHMAISTVRGAFNVFEAARDAGVERPRVGRRPHCSLRPVSRTVSRISVMRAVSAALAT